MFKPLPIGIQDFRKLIEGGYLYVDKTRWIYELIRNPSGVYFLARPRRFGKSLLISTLEEIFRGNRALFHGLWLDDQPYDWQTFPVIRMDLSLYRADNAEHLKLVLAEMLGELAERAGVELGSGDYLKRFRDLIWRLAGDHRVVILVDEYDKPLLDHLDDLAEARRVREVLRSFYGVIKGMDAHIRFVMLTGVSKFSKVGVFSGLNNLFDLSLDPTYSAILGITQDELEMYLAGNLIRLAAGVGETEPAVLARIRAWYNGFCFSKACQSVYNPFSLLLALERQDYGNFWFDTGTPTFLIKLIEQRGYDVRSLDNLDLDELAFSAYDLDELPVAPLLYQTGYLTIKQYDPASRLYRLGYPNYEVEHAFLTYLLAAFTPADIGTAGAELYRLRSALQAADFDRVFTILRAFFAGIPYDIQMPQERYYQTVFYLIFRLLGLQTGVEVRSSRGRADAVVELADSVLIFEFKLEGTPADALAQIRRQGYAEPYQSDPRPVYLVGVRFDLAQRTVAAWEIARE
jgi:hypothetical protein